MWIARDKDGQLVLFTHKPTRGQYEWNETMHFWMYLSACNDNGEYTDFVYGFKNLTWEDEPIEVRLETEEKPMKFRLSEEAIKMIEKDTGKLINQLKSQPLHYHDMIV